MQNIDDLKSQILYELLLKQIWNHTSLNCPHYGGFFYDENNNLFTGELLLRDQIKAIFEQGKLVETYSLDENGDKSIMIAKEWIKDANINRYLEKGEVWYGSGSLMNGLHDIWIQEDCLVGMISNEDDYEDKRVYQFFVKVNYKGIDKRIYQVLVTQKVYPLKQDELLEIESWDICTEDNTSLSMKEYLELYELVKYNYYNVLNLEGHIDSWEEFIGDIGPKIYNNE